MKKVLLLLAGAALTLNASAINLNEGAEYFVQNVKTGMWLNGGYSWGTKGILKNQARAFEFIPVVGENGKYILKSSCGYFEGQGTDTYISAGEGNAAKLTVAEVSEGIFTIANGDKYISAKADMQTFGGSDSWESQQGAMHSYDFYDITDVDDSSDDAAKWKIVSKEAMIANLGNANADAPMDATFLIKAHMMDVSDSDNKTAWLVNGETDKIVTPDADWFGYNTWIKKGTYGWYINDNPEAETETVISQEATGLPAGNYSVDYRVVNQANTPLTLTFNSTTAEAVSYDYSDLWYDSCARTFNDQSNIKSADFTVGEDGKLSIKMTKTCKPENQNRMGFKSFVLKYKGNGSASAVTTVFNENADAPAEYYTLQGIRVAEPSTGLYIVKKGNTVSKELIRR